MKPLMRSKVLKMLNSFTLKSKEFIFVGRKYNFFDQNILSVMSTKHNLGIFQLNQKKGRRFDDFLLSQNYENRSESFLLRTVKMKIKPRLRHIKGKLRHNGTREVSVEKEEGV